MKLEVASDMQSLTHLHARGHFACHPGASRPSRRGLGLEDHPVNFNSIGKEVDVLAREVGPIIEKLDSPEP